MLNPHEVRHIVIIGIVVQLAVMSYRVCSDRHGHFLPDAQVPGFRVDAPDACDGRHVYRHPARIGQHAENRGDLQRDIDFAGGYRDDLALLSVRFHRGDACIHRGPYAVARGLSVREGTEDRVILAVVQLQLLPGQDAADVNGNRLVRVFFIVPFIGHIYFR